MKLRNILWCCAVLLMCASCGSTKEVPTLAYFQNLKDSVGKLPDNVSNYKIKIQPDDELIITITSTLPEATAMYNLPLGNPSLKGNINATQSPRIQTHIVDRNGMIQLPVLGEIQAAGLSTKELEAVIKNRVSEHVKDPFVRVEMINFTVNVMGEVRAPQRIVVGKERFSVLDALAAAGDLTEYGKRDNVLVIRTENGKSTYHRLNLTDGSIYASPYFYLQQNDVVYVEPNDIKIDNSKYNQFSAFKLSQLSTIVSLASVIASLVIALSVK
ncbi:MAG: polysaccharide biosynthesis/export family protein [Muribaculaceae bacterium]|nr:polysaccharide biosynthesis/export family protein [Muribaculaceae bacterium]